MSATKAEITVFNTKVRVIRIGDDDYFCITDLAKFKNPANPDMVIRSWLNTKRELVVLGCGSSIIFRALGSS